MRSVAGELNMMAMEIEKMGPLYSQVYDRCINVFVGIGRCGMLFYG